MLPATVAADVFVVDDSLAMCLFLIVLVECNFQLLLNYIRLEFDEIRVHFIKSWHLVTVDNADLQNDIVIRTSHFTLQSAHYLFKYIKFRCLGLGNMSNSSHQWNQRQFNHQLKVTLFFGDCFFASAHPKAKMYVAI